MNVLLIVSCTIKSTRWTRRYEKFLVKFTRKIVMWNLKRKVGNKSVMWKMGKYDLRQ